LSSVRPSILWSFVNVIWHCFICWFLFMKSYIYEKKKHLKYLISYINLWLAKTHLNIFHVIYFIFMLKKKWNMANFDWLQFLFLLRASFFISKWGSRLMVIHKIHWVSQIIWFAVKLIKTTRISVLEVCVAVMGANWFWFRKFPLWFLDIDGIISLALFSFSLWLWFLDIYLMQITTSSPIHWLNKLIW
jgi:hypothetical protein